LVCDLGKSGNHQGIETSLVHLHFCAARSWLAKSKTPAARSLSELDSIWRVRAGLSHACPGMLQARSALQLESMYVHIEATP
jgi:hypothetical protein